jgi:hypothetical protein
VNINGESGAMTAAVWCKDHCPTKTIVHRMHDIVDESGLNALQLYVQNFKQADLALTGTVRKATLVNQSTKISAVPFSSSTVSNRRASTTVISSSGRGSISNIKPEDTQTTSTAEALEAPTYLKSPAKVCDTCGVDVSPKWWPYPALPVTRPGPLKQLYEHRPSNNQLDDISKDLGNAILGSNPKQQVALAAAARGHPTMFRSFSSATSVIGIKFRSPKLRQPYQLQRWIKMHPSHAYRLLYLCLSRQR